MAPTAIRLARRGVDGAFSDVPWIRLIGIALSCGFISLGSVCGDWSRHESTSSPARISERDIGHLPYDQCCAPKPDGCGFPWFRLAAGASIDSGCHASPREVACHRTASCCSVGPPRPRCLPDRAKGCQWLVSERAALRAPSRQRHSGVEGGDQPERIQQSSID